MTIGMTPRIKRAMSALIVGFTAVVLLGLLAKRLPAGSRSLETMLLFALLIAACLTLDRLTTFRQTSLG